MGLPGSEEPGNPVYFVLGSGLAIICLERGIPSRYGSSARADYVPAVCTHRPSLPGTEPF